VLRINHFPPESETVRTMTPADSLRVFEGLGNPAAATFGKGGRHPLMHRTETIDYAIVLSGQITMVMDDQDVHLEAGDVLIQCGTNHAWSNRSKEPCMVAFILIDGDFDQSLEAKFATALLPRS
jgi:mannose-6-phosphate isomerase-like protein (cupin superfamily)